MSDSARQRLVDEGCDRVEAIIARAMVEVDQVADEVETTTGVRIIPPSPLSGGNWRDHRPALRVVGPSDTPE